MDDTEAYDDDLYKDMKRGDSVLLWDDALPRKLSRALVQTVHDVRTLTLVAVLDHTAAVNTPDEREHLIAAAEPATIYARVTRFNRSGTGSRHLTWCGIS